MDSFYLLFLYHCLFAFFPFFFHPLCVLGCRDKMFGSSDDSDSDISPWLSSVPSPAGTSPSHTRPAAAHTTLVVGKRSIQLHDCESEGML